MSDENEPLLIQPLPSVVARSDGPYTFVDRYRDFNIVFGSELGKRVLIQILRQCEGMIPSEDQPHSVMAAYCSRMKLADWLKRVIAIPPAAQDKTT